MVAVEIHVAGRRFHRCGGVAAGVGRDFLNVHGHFLTGACARPPFRGDFPAVTGDFLTVNLDFPAARGGRANVDADFPNVGGHFPAVSGDFPNVNGGCWTVNGTRHQCPHPQPLSHPMGEGSVGLSPAPPRRELVGKDAGAPRYGSWVGGFEPVEPLRHSDDARIGDAHRDAR